MARKAYARRYAEAVFEIAIREEDTERWDADLNSVQNLLQDETVSAVLANPKLPLEAKGALVSERIKGINPLVVNLVKLLILRDSLGMLGDIIREFHDLLDEYRGVEHAVVTTAVPLEEPERQRIIKMLNALTGKKIEIESEVDPGIIGGLIVRMRDTLLDGSTRSRLEALKKELAGHR
ncbi:MAG: ATP synthase F1 subunit delta [Chloroflexi bacterium]|nr:ATP synthase F1 subunit delta [Chloroflexota bacterium]